MKIELGEPCEHGLWRANCVDCIRVIVNEEIQKIFLNRDPSPVAKPVVRVRQASNVKEFERIMKTEGLNKTCNHGMRRRDCGVCISGDY